MLQKDPKNRIDSNILLLILAKNYSEDSVDLIYDLMNFKSTSSIYLGYFYSS